MIQELLGAVVEERKISVPGPLVVDTSPATSSVSSHSQSSAQSPSSASENLRCPRCDSSNTKFCYYNNYNLTQPRHFCKTCRRYWTKGGALRNVPIGGGCRKAKAAASVLPSIASGKAGAGGKPTRLMAADTANMGRMGLGGGHSYSYDLLPSLWGTCSMQVPHSSHLLAQLLRASQVQQNHNSPIHNSTLLNAFRMDRVKEEGIMDGAHMVTNTLDPFCSNYHQQQNQNFLLADTPTSSGIQELYQRLQSPANNDNLQLFNNSTYCTSSPVTAAMPVNTAAATAATDHGLEPIPLMSGGEFGYWNPMASWADLPTPNGAFP